MLILLKFKQEFKKIKSNLHIFFVANIIYICLFFCGNGILLFFQACLSLFRCCIRPLAILGR